MTTINSRYYKADTPFISINYKATYSSTQNKRRWEEEGGKANKNLIIIVRGRRGVRRLSLIFFYTVC